MNCILSRECPRCAQPSLSIARARWTEALPLGVTAFHSWAPEIGMTG